MALHTETSGWLVHYGVRMLLSSELLVGLDLTWSDRESGTLNIRSGLLDLVPGHLRHEEKQNGG